MHSERLIGTRTSAEKGLKGCFLNSEDEGGAELLVMELMHLINHLDSKYVVKCLLPVRLVKLLGSINNIITVVLWSKLECFLVIGFN